MPSVASQRILGLKELDYKLRQLSRPMRGEILEKAAKAAGNVVLPAAIANCPESDIARLMKTYKGNWTAHPGFAKRNVAMKPYVSKDRRAAGVKIGVKREAYYAINFVELTTSRRAGTPWLQPAFNSTKDKQIDAWGQVIVEELGRVARRHVRAG